MRYRRRPEALWRRSLDSVLVLLPGDEEITRIAGGGVVVWLALDDVRSIDELVADVADAFGSVPDALRGEIEATVDHLLSRRCLEVLV